MTISETTNATLTAVSETLLIPLYSRALESMRPDASLKDEKAVALLTQSRLDFSHVRQIKMNDLLHTMRIIFTREMDRYARNFINQHTDPAVIHIGCGLDSRFERVDNGQVEWYDLDLPEVIALRWKYLGGESGHYHLLACSILDDAWLENLRDCLKTTKKGKIGPIWAMAKSTQTYPTDFNDTEWAQIAPLLPTAKSTGRPREHSWRDILDAIFYVTKNGCVWRTLPSDFPAWQTVYYYFRMFRKTNLWEQLNTAIRKAVRIKAGKEPQAGAMIIDRQSAKSAEGGEKIGFDGGKQERGRKRTLITDTLGLVVLAKVASANTAEVHAGKEALLDLKSQPELIERLKKIFADGGYRDDLVNWVKNEFNADLEIVLKLGTQKPPVH